MNAMHNPAKAENHPLTEAAKTFFAIILSVIAFIPLVIALLFAAFVVVVLCIRSTPEPNYQKYIGS